MKRCPKCNRTFPDEHQKFCTVDGGLLITEPAFDPNATIRATPAELEIQPPRAQRDNAMTSRELPNPDAMVANSNAPTVAFRRDTGPTSVPTASRLPSPPSGQSTAAPGVSTQAPQTKKRSNYL